MTFEQINEITGFANGDKFTSDDQVRRYFQIDEMRGMFGGAWHNDDEQGDDESGVHVSQATLDEMAQQVIDNRWHMVSE